MKKRVLIDNHWRDLGTGVVLDDLWSLLEVGIDVLHIGVLKLMVRRSYVSIEILGIELCFVYRPSRWPW